MEVIRINIVKHFESAHRAQRKTQRKEEKPEGGVVDEVDEMREMRELAEAQAALFRIGSDDETGPIDLPIPHGTKAIDR